MTSALIGYTGFVGGNLQNSEHFDLLINRENLETLRGRHLDRIVCAGLPAAKWLANKDPDEDLANMQRLCDVLSEINCDRFILISTIDVYPVNEGADEDFDCSQQDNHAYGRHRLMFENFVREHFPDARILRLPALFGTGLKKNVIFDLLNDNCLEMINPVSRFQWYPLARLAADIKLVENSELKLVNLFTEPLSNQEILDRFFPDKEVGAEPTPSASYNLITRHASLFGTDGDYIMNKQQVLDELARYIDQERSR